MSTLKALNLWYFTFRAEQDYRRVAPWARRMDESWLHQEANLVAQVEKYLKGLNVNEKKE